MNKLTDKQFKFLRLISKLHNDPFSGFDCQRPVLVERVLKKKWYDSGDVVWLRIVRTDYIEWKTLTFKTCAIHRNFVYLSI
jgi:hypothetical protein